MRFVEIMLTEGVEEVSVFNKPVQVLRNPQAAQLLAQAKRKTLRGLIDPISGDTFWWSASAAIHPSVALALGLGDIHSGDSEVSRLEMRGNAIYIISKAATASESTKFRHLVRRDIGIRWQKSVISFDDYMSRIQADR